MHPLFANKATVNPALLINKNSSFSNFESDSASSLLDPPVNEESSNHVSAENDGDPFVPGSAHRGKKRRKVKDRTSDAMNNILDIFQEKWKEDKEAQATIRQEEKEERERMFDVMAKSQQSISDAVDVLKFIAQKM